MGNEVHSLGIYIIYISWVTSDRVISIACRQKNVYIRHDIMIYPFSFWLMCKVLEIEGADVYFSKFDSSELMTSTQIVSEMGIYRTFRSAQNLIKAVSLFASSLLTTLPNTSLA